MADKSDVLLQLYVEERSQARQMEDQRASLTNIIILAVAAGLALVASRGFELLSTLAVSVPMVALGLFGMLATVKYFQGGSGIGDERTPMPASCTSTSRRLTRTR